MYWKTTLATLAIAFLAVGQSLVAQERLAQNLVSELNEEERSLLERRAALEVKGVSLDEALTQLGYAAGVGLAFSPSLLPEDRRVSCECRKESLGFVLDRLLEGTDLSYSVMGSQVVVQKAPKPIELRVPQVPTRTMNGRFASSPPSTRIAGAPIRVQSRQEGALTGMVQEASTLEPLSAVQVSIPELGRGVLTSGNGRFSFDEIPAGTYTVRAERIGYQVAEISVEVQSGATANVELRLRTEALRLDQVVVTGTGRETRTREMGTSVGQVDASDFRHAPVRSTEDILMGREAGVTVELRSGQPGAMSQITLRGPTSVDAYRNQPLIYVDGVRLYSHGIRGAQNARQGVHALQSIPAQDIERIEVVRGAAASTLYGSEAAGGVIQIFTKQGASGDAVWEVDLGAGLNTVSGIGPGPYNQYVDCAGEMEVLERGTWDWLTMRDPTCPSSGSWISNGRLLNLGASVRGGGENLTYFVSGQRDQEEGVIAPGQSTSTRVRGNFAFTPADNLSVSVSSQYYNNEIRWIPDGDRGSGFFVNVMRGPESRFQDDAECAGMNPVPDICLVNARVLSHQVSHQWTDHFTLGGTVRWEPSTSLSQRFTLGYDYIDSLGQEIVMFGFHRAGRDEGRIRDRRQFRGTLSIDYVGSWTVEEVLGRDIASSFSWGAQLVETDWTRLYTTADNFAGPGLTTLDSARETAITSDIQRRTINPGVFFQEQIGFQDRFYLTLGLRVDGHSAFGEDFGFQTYPKIGASWVVSDHDFWPDHIFQAFRVRGALGEAGAAPGAFDATRTWDIVPVVGGFTPNVLGNSELGPERTREIELGFEATTLENRLALELNTYLHDTKDALIGVQPIPSTGFLSRQDFNIGHIQSRGFEFSVDAELYRSPTLSWSARGHYAWNESEAIDLAGETAWSSQRQQVSEGNPVPSYVGPRLLNPDEFADPIYSDGDEFLGPSWPVHNIGIGTTVMLGDRITFDAQGEFQGGHLVQNSTGYQNALRGTWAPCWDIQRAMATGDEGFLSGATARDRVRCSIDPAVQDGYQWLEDGDFFKLRVVSLTYDIPQRWLPGLDQTTVTVSGRNLLEITDYSGVSVEANQGSNPNTMTRRDHYQVPPYRTFQISVKTRF